MIKNATQKEFEEIKRLYDVAIKEGKVTFKFQDREFLTSYFGYYLQYLNNKKYEDITT